MTVIPGSTYAEQAAAGSITRYDSSVSTSELNPQAADIDATTAGNAIIIAAVPGKRIFVLSYVLVSAGTVDITWKSGGTSISGAMSLSATGGIAVPTTNIPYFNTGEGEALVLTLSDAVAVRGHITYTVR